VVEAPRSLDAVKVLLVEDDDRLARLTARYLEGHGASVMVCTDGDEGLREANRRQYDAILLDLMLPGKDGLTVCREIRSRQAVPIIVLTARTEEADRVMGLELGADDYVTKPYSSRELVARIRAVVRRSRGGVGPTNERLTVGPLEIDPQTLGVKLDGRELALTTYEFALLRALAEHAGRVLSREQLLDLAKGSAEESFDRSIDVHVSRLRAKLADDPRRPRLIKTVRGMGYMLAQVHDA
jgi:two-component system, OmpR family, response regulator